MRRIRSQSLITRHIPKWALAAVSLAIMNGCFQTAGGSGETGNPEIELALTRDGKRNTITGTLRIFAGDHDPLADSMPLMTKTVSHQSVARVTVAELSAAYSRLPQPRALHGKDPGFNCILSTDTLETLLDGFRLVGRGGTGTVDRITNADTVVQDRSGRLRIQVSLDRALTDVRGTTYGLGLETELEWIWLKGTPYRAAVREGGFRFERIARGRYTLIGQSPLGERFVSVNPFDTDSPGTKMEWTKEPLGYQATDSGFFIEGVDASNPFIYDNDLFTGGVDDEYMWAKASLGANLRGIIATRNMEVSTKPDTLPGGYNYSHEQCILEAEASVARAIRSGMKNLPAPVPGAGEKLVRPASGSIGDTRVQSSPGTDLILREARAASPRKPLVIFVGGGQATTVASAYLLDPSIARRILVIGTSLAGSASKDTWAAYILAKRIKLINFGESPLYWPQRPQPTVLPPERFQGLPVNEVIHALDSLANFNWINSVRAVAPSRDGGFNDGAGLFLIFAPKSWTKVVRQVVDPAGITLEASPTAPFDLINAVECDFGVMTEAYFSTFATQGVF